MNQLNLRHLPIYLHLLLLCLGLSGAATGNEYFDGYDLPKNVASVDIGLQPLGYPTGMIGAVMRRDRVLRHDLAASGQPLSSFPFRRGADMVDLMAEGRLEAGLLGDMPTILLAARSDVAIAGLLKRTSTALVSREEPMLARLKGKRLGYVPLSSAHHTLLQGLASAGLGEADVSLVALGVDEMPDALAQGRIDAFAAWEPAPSVALARNPQARIVFRGLSSDYFVLTRSFVQKNPEAARVLVAGFARAIEWMRRSRKNIETAARWTMIDGSALSGKAPAVTLAQAVDIARREILDVPSAPAILAAPVDQPYLLSEFRFLQKLGKLPADSTWERAAKAFDYDGLQQVLAAPGKYRLHTFDYDQ